MELIAESDNKHEGNGQQFRREPSHRDRPDRPPRQNAENEVFQNVPRLSANNMGNVQLFGTEGRKKKLERGDDNSRGSAAGEGIRREEEDNGRSRRAAQSSG